MLLVALALLAAACGADTDPILTSANRDDAPSAMALADTAAGGDIVAHTNDADAAGDADAALDANAGRHDEADSGADVGPEASAGTLRMALVGAPAVDPLAASPVVPTDMAVVDLLYDGLTEWDPAADTWAAGLAESVAATVDGRSWQFVLVDDVRFSDGSPITSEDVVRSFTRARLGAPAIAATRLDVVDAITAVDDRTVRFDLDQPFALFPALLSSPVYGIVPPGVLDGSVGSGPMTLVGSDLVTRSAPGETGVAAVSLVSVADEHAATAAFEAGAVDLVYVSSGFVGDVDASVPGTVEVDYAVNAAALPLSTSDRTALLAAVDAAAVTAAAFGPAAEPMVDSGRAATGAEACEACDGLELTVGYVPLAPGAPNAGREVRMATALSDNWADQGVTVELRALDLDSFVSAAAAGDLEVIRTGWVGLFPSADSRLAAYVSGGADNVSGLADETFDGLFAIARASGADDDYLAAEEHLDSRGVRVRIARLLVRALVADSVDGLVLRHDGSFNPWAVVVD